MKKLSLKSLGLSKLLDEDICQKGGEGTGDGKHLKQ